MGGSHASPTIAAWVAIPIGNRRQNGQTRGGRRSRL